ncbi:Uncharacterised protein r2_g3365 [Pycnogonum litorale]
MSEPTPSSSHEALFPRSLEGIQKVFRHFRLTSWSGLSWSFSSTLSRMGEHSRYMFSFILELHCWNLQTVLIILMAFLALIGRFIDAVSFSVVTAHSRNQSPIPKK